MNKQAILAVALLSITGYSWAKDHTTKESVQITLKVSIDNDLFAEVLKEVQEDAKALVEKYEPICGINAVQTEVKRGGQEEQVTKSCGCSCKCKSCSSGSCCKCKSVRSLNEDEFCNCQITQEKCSDCGKVTEELRCNCGKPKPHDVEVDRCACGKQKPKTQDVVQ